MAHEVASFSNAPGGATLCAMTEQGKTVLNEDINHSLQENPIGSIPNYL